MLEDAAIKRRPKILFLMTIEIRAVKANKTNTYLVNMQRGQAWRKNIQSIVIAINTINVDEATTDNSK